MTGTFLCPTTCGFARAIAYQLSVDIRGKLKKNSGESNAKYASRLIQEQYLQFNSTFEKVKENFTMPYIMFAKKLPPLRDIIKKWSPRDYHNRKKYLDVFSLENWKKLSDTKKQEHSFMNCRGCAVRFPCTQALFPVKSTFHKSKALTNPVFAGINEASRAIPNSSGLKPSQKDMKQAVKNFYDKTSPIFQKTYNASLGECLSKVPDLNIQHQTKNEIRKKRRNQYRASKQNIENQMQETAFLR